MDVRFRVDGEWRWREIRASEFRREHDRHATRWSSSSATCTSGSRPDGVSRRASAPSARCSTRARSGSPCSTPTAASPTSTTRSAGSPVARARPCSRRSTRRCCTPRTVRLPSSRAPARESQGAAQTAAERRAHPRRRREHLGARPDLRHRLRRRRADPRVARGRLRVEGHRGPAAPRRPARRAHRPAQPPAAHRPPRARADPRSRRSGTRLAIYFIDLDDLKRVNDTHPWQHRAGDVLLTSTAAAVRDDAARGRHARSPRRRRVRGGLRGRRRRLHDHRPRRPHPRRRSATR